MSEPTERPTADPTSPSVTGPGTGTPPTVPVPPTGPAASISPDEAVPPKGRPGEAKVTRTSALFVATGAVLVLGILTVVFILQNLQQVRVEFLGLAGSLPLGAALLIGAIAGGTLVLLAGAARILQLRRNARRRR